MTAPPPPVNNASRTGRLPPTRRRVRSLLNTALPPPPSHSLQDAGPTISHRRPAERAHAPISLEGIRNYRAYDEQPIIHMTDGVGCFPVCATLRTCSMFPTRGRPKPSPPMDGNNGPGRCKHEEKIRFFYYQGSILPGTGNYWQLTSRVGTSGERYIVSSPRTPHNMPPYVIYVWKPREYT